MKQYFFLIVGIGYQCFLFGYLLSAWGETQVVHEYVVGWDLLFSAITLTLLPFILGLIAGLFWKE